MSLDIENTEIAFRSKTNPALRRSYWIFRIMAEPFLVKTGTKATELALALHLPVKGIIRHTFFRQFCGGETLEDCGHTIDDLARFNIGTILDYSVEGSQTEKDFDHTASEIQKTIELSARRPDQIPFCVFKVTGIARITLLSKLNDGKGELQPPEREEWERARSRMLAICESAHHNKVRTFVDAEESWIQNTIDQLTTEMMARFNQDRAIIFNTLQMYRKDRLTFLQTSVELAKKGGYHLGLKIVRGAYMEKERARAQTLKKESPILPDKASTDRAYDLAVESCVQHIDRVAICAGTHNEDSTRRLATLMDRKGIARKDTRVFFSQLLGMSDHLSYNLADEGYNVAKYVPYGPIRSVMPYLIRRAEENTAIQGQTNRQLSLLETELRRRRTGVPIPPQIAAH